MADYSKLYMFPGGTPTEKRRQFDLGLEDTQNARQQDALRAAVEFREKKRQFDLGYGLEKQRNDYEVNKPYFDPNSGGGDGGSSPANPVNPFGTSNSSGTVPIGTGYSNGDLGLYSAATSDMLQGQARHRKALSAGEKRGAHNYNSYITNAIYLAQATGDQLTSDEIRGLQEQAKSLYEQDATWKK